MQAMKHRNGTTFTLQELGMAWTPSLFQQAPRKMKQIFKRTVLVTSNSNNPVQRESNYQPGGTCICITRNSVARVVDRGLDPLRLGWWSCVRLTVKTQTRDKQKSVAFISGCRVSQTSSSCLGTETAYMQQKCLLHKQGMPSVCPKQQWVNDMEEQIIQWKILEQK